MAIWHLAVCGNFRFRVIHGYEKTDIRCPMREDHITSMKNEDVMFEFSMHPPYPDLVGYIGDWLVTDSVRRELESAGLAGLEYRKAECWGTTSDGAERLEYWEARFTGWGGVVSPSSGMRLLSHCPYCGLNEFSRLENTAEFVDDEQWDGSDAFQIYPLGRFVSDRLRKVVERSRFTGVRFEPAEAFATFIQRNSRSEHTRVAGLRHWFGKSEAEHFRGAAAVW